MYVTWLIRFYTCAYGGNKHQSQSSTELLQMWNQIYLTGQTVRLLEQEEVNEVAVLTYTQFNTIWLG